MAEVRLQLVAPNNKPYRQGALYSILWSHIPNLLYGARITQATGEEEPTYRTVQTGRILALLTSEPARNVWASGASSGGGNLLPWGIDLGSLISTSLTSRQEREL